MIIDQYWHLRGTGLCKGKSFGKEFCDIPDIIVCPFLLIILKKERHLFLDLMFSIQKKIDNGCRHQYHK